MTLILEKQNHASNIISAGKATVGVRIPDHPLTQQLLSSLNFPLVAPSANRSNHISPTHPDHVRTSFGENPPFVLDGGATSKGIESTIIGFKENQPIIYRHGAISKEQIEDFLQMNIYEISDESEILAPGMMKKHYSPVIPLRVTDDLTQELRKHHTSKIGLLLAKSDEELESKFVSKTLSRRGNLEESMKNLYDFLYQLEKEDIDLIIAEKVAQEGVGLAINDKLIEHHTNFNNISYS